MYSNDRINFRLSLNIKLLFILANIFLSIRFKPHGYAIGLISKTEQKNFLKIFKFILIRNSK